MFKETKTRSIVKTISWRILATLTTITLVYIFIGDTTIAFTVGGIEVFLKMLVYFIHERVWDKLKFLTVDVYSCKSFSNKKAVKFTEGFWKCTELEHAVV